MIRSEIVNYHRSTLSDGRGWMLETERRFDALPPLDRAVGLGRIVALHHRASTSYQTHCVYNIFCPSVSETTRRPNPRTRRRRCRRWSAPACRATERE